MDITIIKPEETTTTEGILIGSPQATTIVKEFLNLRCPYCRQWFNQSKEVLAEALATESVARLIKLADRPKESLQRGNVMHRFVTTNDGAQALADIQAIFDTQDEWGNLSLEEVANYAQTTLHLTEHNHLEYAEKIVAETQAAVIQFVPTIIVNDHIFDESISNEDLHALLAEN